MYVTRVLLVFMACSSGRPTYQYVDIIADRPLKNPITFTIYYIIIHCRIADFQNELSSKKQQIHNNVLLNIYVAKTNHRRHLTHNIIPNKR